MKLFLKEKSIIPKEKEMEVIQDFLEIITTIVEGFFGAKYLKNKYPYLKKMNPFLFLFFNLFVNLHRYNIVTAITDRNNIVT